MSPRNLMAAAAIIVVAAVATACSSAATPAPATAAPATQAPASPAAGGPAIKTATVGSAGTVLVAGSNGKTLYVFAKDVKDSGKSACSGDCIGIWPALTVAAGTTPVGDTGVTGKIGTITRDDGATQVTYNGLPLYFYTPDTAPGDAKGVYTDWTTVKP